MTDRSFPALVVLAVVVASNDGSLADERPVAFVAKNCLECHDRETAEGEVVLEGLSFDLKDDLAAALWKRAMEQVAFDEMPPREAERPDATARDAFVKSVEFALLANGHNPGLREKLRSPEYGNYVDHDKLFDGSITAPAYTPARLWKRNPHIFDASVDAGLGVTKPGRYGSRPAAFNKVKQPFTLEERAGINDYAALTLADSATLSTMMRNADLVVEKMLGGAVHEAYVAEHGEIPDEELPKDKRGKPIRPRHLKTPEPFREIVLQKEPPTDEQVDAAVRLMYASVIEREPSDDDVLRYRGLVHSAVADAGNAEGLRLGLVTIAISPAAVYRSELGRGPVDEHGRRMLGPVELAYAVAYALTDRKPDDELLKAATSGRLATREDVAREVTRLWDDPAVEKPRVLRFFREFFGYDGAPGVFKDQARFGKDYRQVPERLVTDCDVLVQHVVDVDRNVFEQLLTTEKYFVAHSGDNEVEREKFEALAKFYEYYADKPWKEFPYQVPAEHLKEVRSYHRMFTHANGNVTKRWMQYLTHCAENGLGHVPMNGGREYLTAYSLSDRTFDYTWQQPFVLDADNRVGVLMHPAWLIAHSLNLDNDPVRRGKWIRERLLAGTVPELPITVDARIPENPHDTLRERFEVVRDDDTCWRCHERMNPLGLPFETFDDFGRHRRGIEKLHAPRETKPVDSTGFLAGTGNAELDGEVENPVEMIRRIAKSDRARQSFVRHAFRYWMGRNETLNDSVTLRAADRAYVENEGSFRALVVSLLTSDSFLYRKDEP